MVAKINRGASLYGAVIYNQQKVNEATGSIIAGNRMITDSLYDPDRIVSQTMFAFESYLAANRNTEKPILHISLNPTLDDNLTDSQFADLARAYMQKMGYGNQPYIVYLHEDIDRRHIHIVSTCVNEIDISSQESRTEIWQLKLRRVLRMLMLCLWHSVALRTLLGPMPEPLFGCVMATLFLRTEVTIWQRFRS